MYRETKDDPAVNLFEDLLAVPAPSGCEGRIAQVIQQKLDSWGYIAHKDPAGNLVVRLQNHRAEGPLCCLAAHMDEIGVVVTRIEPDGSLRVDRSGGLYPWKIGEGPLEILGDEETIVGVLSMGSTHVAGAGSHAVTWPDVRVLTGHSPARLRAAGIRPGSTGVPLRAVCGPVVFGDPDDPLVGAWTFDDRMGVVALLRLLETMQQQDLKPAYPTVVAFTVREEVGGQGAMVVAQREQPELFIAVDGCPMPPGAPLQLDGRPAIWCRDSRTPYDPDLIRDLCRAAQDAGTELQPVAYDAAASDASLVFSVGAAPRIGCFGHVRENSHGFEVARLSCFENVHRTLVQFIQQGASR